MARSFVLYCVLCIITYVAEREDREVWMGTNSGHNYLSSWTQWLVKNGFILQCAQYKATLELFFFFFCYKKKITVAIRLVYSFLEATIRNYCKFGGWKQHKFILWQFWKLRSPKSTCQQVFAPFEDSREEFFLTSS